MRKLRLARSWLLVLGALALPALSAGGASAGLPVVGRLYTETNARHNQVLILDRYSDGSLRQVKAVSTGGLGSAGRRGCKPADACDILDSQGQLDLVASRHLLFAVNAGSDTVSSFRVTAHGLQLIDRKSSGGSFPNSLASRGNLLYVANTGSLNVVGFHFTAAGKLQPIAGSSRRLDRRARAGAARQLGFDNTGHVLAVTVLKPAEVETFLVGRDGKLSQARAYQTQNPLPFGFVFDHADRMAVTQIHDFAAPHGSLATYDLTRGTGKAQLVASQPTQGLAPCWIVLGRGGRFLYVVNASGGNPSGATIAVFGLGPDGSLTALQHTAPMNNAAGVPEFERTNALLSSDGRFFYVLVPGGTKPTSRLDIYSVGADGKLALSAVTPSDMPGGISGLVGG